MHTRVTLRFGKRIYEYDIYSLLKAFWPDAEISLRYTEDCAQHEAELREVPDAQIVCEILFAESASGEQEYRFRVLPCDEHGAAVLSLAPGSEITKRTVIPAGTEKIAAKNRVKEMVYRTMAEQTGRELPWGDLTGIRPVRLMSGLLQKGMTGEEAMRYMRGTWFVSERKAQLALATAEREEEILRGLAPEQGWSLYIGIPFCPTICLYCSFGSHPLALWKDRVDAYLDAMSAEMRAVAEIMKGRRLDTVYIGGGTPTSLTERQLLRLLEDTSEIFPVGDLREFTVEAGRPDTITREKLKILKQFPVDRISVNPQTMNPQTLERIGRKHTVEETVQAFGWAREAGFTNINMDLIVGLPGEGEAEVAHTLEEIRELSPDSLTVHSLALKRATRLHLYRDAYEEESFRNSEQIMGMAEACASDLGMTPYYLYRQKNIAGNFENVGYARKGKACLYNILIMEQRQTIVGVGSGASTKLIFGSGDRVDRVENVRDLKQYLERTEEMIERKKTGMAEYLSE